MKIFSLKNKLGDGLCGFENSDFYQFLIQAKKDEASVEKAVEEIISNTTQRGDEALISYSNKFDKTSFTKPSDFVVSKKEIADAEKKLSKELHAALQTAFARIESYHKKQLPKDFFFTDKIGAKLGNSWRAIDSVGIYAPGGTASYPSSVLMCAVPALVAGVKNLTLCAPSSAGKLNPALLFAAKICGIEKIYKIGGSQAITAFARGTKTISKVDKIVGPGNSFVACAKKILFGEVGIDMIAGPTDLTIICDSAANPSWIAADALSQLEHGCDSKAFIITDEPKFAQKISAEILRLSKKLPRQKIIEESIKNSAIFVIKNLDEAAHLANFIAPEHLEIATKNPHKFLPKIRHAGAIFLGNYSPESIGDYIAGPSHTLPTSGTAKFTSGLSVFDFLKRISVISCSQKSFAKLADATSILAECEGLEAHKLSITIRK